MSAHFIYKHLPASGLGHRNVRRPHVTGGIGTGVPVIVYVLLATSERPPRSASSFDQLMIQSSNEVSMLVGTLAANQSLESNELSEDEMSSRLSMDLSSTMDSMSESSHEHSQVGESSEPSESAESNEYDETQDTITKAHRIDEDG